MEERLKQISHIPPQVFHLMLVVRIVFAVSLLTSAGLALTLAFISYPGGASYAAIIHSFSITRESLGPALAISCLVLVSVAGIMTWLITLYGSFRIAGPLYRFARNIELAISDTTSAPLPIRRNDCLQEISQELVHSIKHLRDHYREIADLADLASHQLESPDSRGETVQTLIRLKEIERRVSLDP